MNKKIINLSAMPKDCDWTIYSAFAPEYKPRCVLMSKDRKSYISETGDTVQQAISNALKEWRKHVRKNNYTN